MEAFVKEKKIIFAMVGLPARGKTYISRKIVCYLNWLGFKAKFFNIGNYRRSLCGTKECTADFFDPHNDKAAESRKQAAIEALNDLVSFLKSDGEIAVYDGTNTTVDRRKMVKEKLEESGLGAYSLVWIESICTDPKIIDNNIRATKLGSPDYKDVPTEQAITDFKHRIEQYEKVYETLSVENDGEETSFIKLFNVTQQITLNQITGYIESKLVSFLMNLHITPRYVYFVRHEESLDDEVGKLGGDSDISERGYSYLPRLQRYFNRERSEGKVNEKTKILVSTMKRATLTADAIDIGAKPTQLKILDDINVGICDGLTYEDIEKKYPDEWKAREANKLKYRYPMGESYQDVINRVEPIIFAIERSKEPIIVVSHTAVIRCIYGYFIKQLLTEIPFIDIPMSTIIKLQPDTYHNHEVRYNLEQEGAYKKMSVNIF